MFLNVILSIISTMEKLSPKNFFSNYFILKPLSSKLSQKDQKIALAASIIIGIISIGSVHLSCAIARSCLKKKTNFNETIKKTDEVTNLSLSSHPSNSSLFLDFKPKIKKHLAELFGNPVLCDQAPIITPVEGDENFNHIEVFSHPIQKGMYKGTPFIALKVVNADPEGYFESHRKRFISRMAKAESNLPLETRSYEEIYNQLKEKEIDSIKKEESIILLHEVSLNTIWTNLGQEKGRPSFFHGRSFTYNVENIPEAGKDLTNFFQAFIF